MVRRSAFVLVLVVSVLLGHPLWVATAAQSGPAAPTVLSAIAMPQGVSVAVFPPTGLITGYHVEAIPLRGASSTTVLSGLLTPDIMSGRLEMLTGLTVGTTYQARVRAVSAAGNGAWSPLSNTFTVTTTGVPPLDPTVTYVLPSWAGLIRGNGTASGLPTSYSITEMAQRLRTEIGEGPGARIGLSVFVQIVMPNWNVDIDDPVAMHAALVSARTNVDTALANAEAVRLATGQVLPIGFSLITAIRERVDGVETAASNEDHRNIEWYTDQTRATGWMTFSQYARKMRRVKEAYIRSFGRYLAEKMSEYPHALVAVTGDGEIEMTSDRFRSQTNPASTSTRSWADYSPFAQAEFRDWLRGTGMYAVGQPLAGQAYQFAARYTNDPSPNAKADGATGNTFNQDFGTAFTTWDLRYHNWSLTDGETAGAITSATGPGTPCVTGQQLESDGYCSIIGGFDAPRPNPTTILTNTDRFWLAFRLFRDQMVHRYNRDFARWITEGTAVISDPALQGLLSTEYAGVPYDRFYSAQVPTDVLFGAPAADGGVRQLTSGSPHWTADIWPYGGMGVTGYNVNDNGPGNANLGVSGNAGGGYERTVSNVAPLVAARARRWSIVEWNPSDPWSTCPDIYRADNLVVRRYRPSLLMPYKIETTSTEFQRVFDSGFATGLKELMTGVVASTATPNCGRPQTVPLVDAPGIAVPLGQTRGGWAPIITWAPPTPILAGVGLTGTQLNATANIPGTFSYSPAAGATLDPGTQTLTATFTPDDPDYAVTTATVSIVVRPTVGSISGRVTAASSGANLQGVTVQAFRNFYGNGPSVATATTLADGTYTLGPLASGEYIVRFQSPGMIDELYGSADTQLYCRHFGSRRCDAGATTIPITSGDVSGINEQLDGAASLQVTVLTEADGAVANVPVVFDDEYQGVTNGAGVVTFATRARAGADFGLQVTSAGGWVSTTAPETTLVLTGGVNAIVRRVRAAGGISGTVLGAGSAPLSGVTVGAYTAGNVRVAETTTNGSGVYTLDAVPAGTYYVKTTANSGGYVNQLYNGIPCEGCAVLLGTAVTVTGTATTPNINFTLTQGRTISGTVTDATFTPIAGVVVDILGAAGQVLRSSAATDATGAYEVAGLAAGNYWVRTRNSSRYVDRMYRSDTPGGVECLACATATGTPIALRTGTGAAGIDFRLLAGGSIAGTVTSATGAIGGASLALYSANDTLLQTVTTDDNGAYRTTLGLPNGSYFVVASAPDYNTEVWNDRGCPACLPSATGVAIEITSGALDVTGKDFGLIKGARVSGRVTSTTAPTNGVVAVVAVLELARPHREVARTTTAPDGTYETPIVPAGSYYAAALATSTHQRQFFCGGDYGGCPTGPGVPFGVGNTTTTGIDMRMAPGASISGTVTAGGNPVSGRRIDVFNAVPDSTPVASVETGLDGTYRTPALGTGEYFLRARRGDGYAGQLYNGVADDGRAPQAGTPLPVTAGTPVTAINFALVAGGRITGRVTDGSAGIVGATVQVFSTAGGRTPVATTETGANGDYTTDAALAPGTYYARARARGYLPELYSEVTCLGCNPQSGAQITVTAGTATPNINFTLTSGGGLSGTVTANGVPKGGITVEIYNAAQTTVTTPVATATTDGNGRWVTDEGLTAGASYYVRTRNTESLIDRLYPAVECEPCALTSGTATPVINGEVTDIGTIALVSGGSITGRVTRTSTGLAVEGITVEVYRSGVRSPRPLQVLTTNESGVYVTQAGLRAGDYVVRTFSQGRVLGLIDEVYNNVECAPCVPQIAGAAIAVSATAVTGIDFSLGERTASIAGVISRGGVAVSGVTVSAYNAAGARIGSAVSATDGAYRIIGLAPGAYFVFGSSSDSGYSAWYDGPSAVADSLADSTAVTLTGGEARTGININASSSAIVRFTANVSIDFTVTLEGPNGETFCATLGADIAKALNLAPGQWTLAQGCTVTVARAGAARSNAIATFTVVEGQETRVVLDAPTCSALPTFSTTTIANGKVGNAYTQIITATGGSAVSYVLADSFLAPGLSLNASTGVISGTPTGAGASVFTVAASDVNGCTATQDFSMNVAAPDPVNGTATPSSLNFSATKSGSTGPLTNLTPAQNVALTFATGVAPAWTATSDRAWLQVSSASGTGPATLAISVADPTNAIGLSTSLSGTVTIAGENIANGPLTILVTLTVDQVGPVNGTVTPAALRFGATKDGASGAVTSVTPAQSVALTFATGGVPSWTATSDQPWLQVGTASGSGPASLSISVSNPSNVIGASTSLSGAITITGANIANGPLTIPVTLTVDQTNGATPSLPFGQVDTPAQNATGVQGAIGVTGWVLDNVGVSSVKIYRNCLPFDNPASCQTLLGNSMVFVGDAAFLAGARSDVEGAFTTTPQANRAGWGYLMLTSMLPHVSSELPNGGVGPLTIYAVATDAEGNQRLLGRSADPAAPDFTTPTSITMANDTIAKPFGAIDTPGQGATVSGVLNNFGWALTPDSNTTGSEVGDILIPTNGSTMTVFIDSVPVAQVAYNQCRGNVGNPVPAGVFCNDDVSSIFGHATPQAFLASRDSNPTRYRNLDAQRAAIGVYSFDTTGLSNGLHTIAWSVTDSASRTEGIGSRFFNVLNSGSTSDQALRARPAAVRGWSSMLTGRTPGTVGVWGRTGFDLAAEWTEMDADAAGAFRVRLPEAGRLELWLGTPADAGYLVAEDGSLRDLPVGSRLDGAQFGWMPPVGYVGPYHLAFVRGNERIDVHVTIAAPTPASADASEIRMHLDPVRVEGEGPAERLVRVEGPVLSERLVRVEGWAFDPKAAIGSGIGAVHVWARRLDVGAAGDTPTFLGVADLHVARADVAESVAGAPGRAGFTFDARLATGTWELTAYVWNVRTGRFEDARSVATIVR
jgi:5-hydroxyisourate hydrolase-like protein (transthyretin family)